MRPGRLALLRLLVLPMLVGCSRPASDGTGTARNGATDSEARRVIVEVLNPGKQVGLARAATLRLRQRGLDVVYFGNLSDTSLAKRERNLVYLRRGDTTGIGRVIAALGDAEIVDRADATRLVDLTVVLGTSARLQGDSAGRSAGH